jgi:RNase P/RNase MRP subunit p29
MQLEQISGPHCVGKSCPTIYKSDRGTIVVQGYVVDEPHNAVLAANESLVEIPAALLAEMLSK